MKKFHLQLNVSFYCLNNFFVAENLLIAASKEEAVQASKQHRASSRHHKGSVFDSFFDKSDPNQYIGKRKYGGNHDDSDESDDDDPDLMDKTPTTKRRMVDEKSKSVVHKLGPCSTFLTLLKGFVASAVLYLPKSFVNGGYGFSIIALLVSCVVTIYCALLLI